MDPQQVWPTLRSGWWLAVLGMIVGACAALGASIAQTPLYTASTRLFVATTEAGTTFDAFQGSQFSQQRVSSYTRLITGEEFARRMIDELDLSVSPAALSRRVSATAVPDTVLIDVAVADPSPERARDIATAMGEEFGDLIATLETPPGADVSPVRVLVVEPPSLPAGPSSPKTTRNTALALLAGLFLGAGAAVLRGQLDRSVRDVELASALTGAPVIGIVPRDRGLEKSHRIDRQNGSGAGEAIRQLRTNLQFLSVDDPPRVIMISSSIPGEGKTTLAVNLAIALADAGRRVTLVEADLRRPRVTRYMGLVGGVGLTNVLAGSATVGEVTQAYGDGGLTVIGAGPLPPNPGELLSSSHMSALLKELREKNDVVILDAPPTLPVADASGLSTFVDGTVLVLRYGVTRREQLQQTAATLQGVGARMLGVVVNLVPPHAALASAYGYDYSNNYEPEAPATS